MQPRQLDSVEHWPLGRLKPYARNPRTHSEEQVAQIAASIVEFGWTSPVLVAGDGTVIAGHGRLEAARRLGLDAMPVVVLEALDPRPDVVLATGDLTDFGRSEEYAELRRLLAPLEIPLYLIPGNHNERRGLVAAFPEHEYLVRDGTYLQYVVDTYPVRLIGLDTVVAGRPEGRLGPDRLAWLEARLAEEPDRPTILFMHHPPFVSGIRHMDVQRLLDGEVLRALVARHPNVERLLCGHLHRGVHVRFAGTIASTAPSVAHQVALDLRPDGPSAFTMEPGAFRLHLWREDGGLVSHTRAVDAFDGPYPFYRDGALID